MLTVGTGDELAAKFGHSAIRFQDPTLGIDEVYGYGTYDFEDPNFYLNFTRGKLAYTISRMPLNFFEREYKFERRWVKEQELDLNLAQRTAIVAFLENNLLPENKKYQYDFLFDNCATRIPQVFEKTLGENLQFNLSHVKETHSFRELIHQNLELNSWSNFGIDLALGSVIDRKATPYEYMFLPIYVYEQMKHTTLNGKPIVKKESVLLDIPPQSYPSIFLLSPLFWLSIFSLLVTYITYRDYKRKARSVWLDISLFTLTGLAGVLIVFLWFFTDHDATKMNFNLLWTFAPNLFVAFVLLKKKLPHWIKKYVILLLTLILLTLILWVFQVQIFSALIIFILWSLAIRYLFLINHLKQTA
ncbi:membrane protein [Maribacter cobaltidurans]|nr:membrane protein [Maribacter cobaltidurans]